MRKHVSHSKYCQCRVCVLARFDAKAREVKDKMNAPRLPSRKNQMVFVQGHFRKHPRYMVRDPALRKFWAAFIRGLMQH